MKKFIYIFPVAGRCAWSGETTQTILRRAANAADLKELTSFINVCGEGSHMELSTGEMVVCTSID